MEDQQRDEGTPESGPAEASQPHQVDQHQRQVPQDVVAVTEGRTPLPGSAAPTRPPHSGWESSSIAMAKCDFCDKRGRGTVYRCKECRLSICKECCNNGCLDQDSRHTLDADSVDWDLHLQNKSKRAKKIATTNTSTRGRGATRARGRGGRARRTVSSRAITAEAGTASPTATIASYDESMVEAGDASEQEVLVRIASSRPSPQQPAAATQEQSGTQLAPAHSPEMHQVTSRQSTSRIHSLTLSQVQARGQPQPSSSGARPLLPMQPSYRDRPAEFRRGPRPYLMQDNRPMQQQLPRTTAHRPIMPRPSQYCEESAPFTPRPQDQYSRGIVGHQGYATHRDRGFRYQPYRLYSPRPGPASHTRDGSQSPYNYRASAPFSQDNMPPIYPLQVGPSAAVWPNNDSSARHQEPLHRNTYSLPPLRDIHRLARPLTNHLPPIRQHGEYQQPPRPEPLVNRIGSQLEIDTLATHADCPTWPLDQCLRHEVARTWSRRGAQASLLREALPSNGPENIGDTFRVLLGATYFATIRLQLEMQNAARMWLIETETQLCDEGLMMPVRAGYQ